MNGGSRDETGHLRREAAEAARHLRAVLDEIADPGSELTASAGMRNRLQGAVAALEAVSRSPRPSQESAGEAASGLP